MSQTYINQPKEHIGESVTLRSFLVRVLCVVASVSTLVGCEPATATNSQNAEPALSQNAVSRQKTPEIANQKEQPQEEPNMPILKEIAKYNKANPSASSQDLADRGNEILPTIGFEFDIDLGKLITKALKSKHLERVKKDGDDDEYFYLTVPLITESGRKTSVRVVAPTFESCCCGYTYTPIPVTQISSTRMTVVIDGKPIVIKRAKDLPVVQEYILYENENAPKKVRSWEAPFETYPYGLSADGTAVYFDTGVDKLLLEVSVDGSLRFVTKDSPGIIIQKEDLRERHAPKVGEILHKSGEFGLYKYIVARKPYILEFPYICT